MKIKLSDIPEQCRTTKYIVSTYGVSRATAWRLVSGKSTHICVGYHQKTVDIAAIGWDVIDDSIMRYMRNIVAHQLKKWRIPPSRHIDDICQECAINAYQKSGVWYNMPEQKKLSYIATLCKRTANDFLKKETNYTDRFKNSDLSAEKEIYPGVSD